MITIHKSNARGIVDHGWLLAKHSFSFGSYQDPNHIGFSDLLVINEDRVAGGRGFAKHPHRNMEIITYVLSGGLKHEDSLGSGSVIRPGDVQVMSAGKGILHSESNAEAHEEVHLLQIWIVPDATGHAPRYAEKKFTESDKRGQFALLVSGDGRDGSVMIHQDARIYAALIDGAENVAFTLPENRYAYVQVARGDVLLNGQRLEQGDGVRITGETALHFSDGHEAEVLLFDLRAHDLPDFSLLKG